MDQATARDLLAWAALATANAAKVNAALADRQAYAAQRMDALNMHPGWTLGQVERDVFGWEPPEVEVEYEDLAEDDDS